MIFWSFVAGVVTFYCSLGPDSLLPNILFTIKYKPKVNASVNVLALSLDLVRIYAGWRFLCNSSGSQQHYTSVRLTSAN